MLRVIKNQRGEFNRPETATKRVLQRKSPMRKGQVLESRNTRGNANRPPLRKPLPLELNEQQVDQSKPSHGSPTLLRVRIRSPKKKRTGLEIIIYALSVGRRVIRSETVLI